MYMFEIYQPTYIPTLKMDWIFHFCIDFFVLPEENALCDKIVHTYSSIILAKALIVYACYGKKQPVISENS